MYLIPYVLYNNVELPQPVIIPTKATEYFVPKNEVKQLNSKPKSISKMHTIAHSGPKEKTSDMMEVPYIKINLTFVFPKPVIDHDFKKKTDLAKKRNRKLKEAARNFVFSDIVEQQPKSFEQLKARDLQALVNIYEIQEECKERPVRRPTLSEWVIAKKAEELEFERYKAECEEIKQRVNWCICQNCANYWDEESARILEQKLEQKTEVGIDLDDLYERTHNMHMVINAFNQKNR